MIAINAAIAIMTAPIGFAVKAAFKTHCTAIHITISVTIAPMIIANILPASPKLFQAYIANATAATTNNIHQ